MSMSHDSTICVAYKFEEIKRRLLKAGIAVSEHLSEMTLFLNYCIFSGSAEALVRCGD